MPVFGFHHEAAFNWIAVHVLQLLDPFVVSEDVEIVVAGLPERTFREASGDRDFQGLQSFRQEIVGRFTDEQVNVLRHDDVAEDFELAMAAGALERVEEDVSCGRSVEVGFAVVATEGDEVVVAFLLISF